MCSSNKCTVLDKVITLSCTVTCTQTDLYKCHRDTFLHPAHTCSLEQMLVKRTQAW